MLAIQLKSAVTVFGGKGGSGLPRVAFELEVRDQNTYLEARGGSGDQVSAYYCIVCHGYRHTKGNTSTKHAPLASR